MGSTERGAPPQPFPLAPPTEEIERSIRGGGGGGGGGGDSHELAMSSPSEKEKM